MMVAFALFISVAIISIDVCACIAWVDICGGTGPRVGNYRTEVAPGMRSSVCETKHVRGFMFPCVYYLEKTEFIMIDTPTYPAGATSTVEGM